MPLALGLIGAGKHGLRYARHIAADVPGVTLAALCRRDRAAGARAAGELGCAYIADYVRLIEDARVEALVVAVPPALHGPIVDAACRAGKPLLLEKPLAVSVAEGRRIRGTLAAAGVRGMVAHTLRFNAVVAALRSRLADIAPLQHMYLSQRFEPSTLGWLDRVAESGGGIVLHTGVHSFDLVRYLSGLEVGRVVGEVGRRFTRETEDSFQLLFATREGKVRGAVTGSRTTLGRNGLIELSGARGQLVGDHVHGYAYLLRGREREDIAVGPPVPTVREAVRAFAGALAAGTPFPVSVDDGLRAVAMAEACYRSAAAGTPAEVEA